MISRPASMLAIATLLCSGQSVSAAAQASERLSAADAVIALSKMMDRCTSPDAFDRKVLEAKGWKLEAGYSLRAPGQRQLSFTNPEVSGWLALRYSFVLPAACSGSVDLADADDFPTVRTGLGEILSAAAVSDPALEPVVAAFIEANEMEEERDFAETETALILFQKRHFNGRTLAIVYSFPKEAKVPI